MKPGFKLMATDPYPGTQTVLRAVALLKAFTDTQPEKTLTELVQALGLHKTTLYRLLTALESEGMLARNPETDAYRLGPELIALGGRAQRANPLRAIGHPELEALAQRSGETASLEIRSGDQVLIIDEVVSQRVLGASPSVGTRWPAHLTSTGKVLLAFQPEAEREPVLAGLRGPEAGGNDAELLALRAALALVREQGYATAMGELEEGFGAVGAPVRDHDGRVIAAVSVGGPVSRLGAERIGEVAAMVKETAERISRALGYRE